MKKIFFLTSAFLFAFVSAIFAKQITPAQSRLVAEEVASSSSLRNNISDLKLIQTVYDESATLRSETVLYYVYNVGNIGFIIVAGDDLIYPVIGYSFTGNFDTDNLPANFRFYLDAIEEVIHIRIANQFIESPKTKEAWNNYISGNSAMLRSTQAVSPMIQTKWGQDDPYNLQCPQIGGQTTLTGCGATSMAQIMKFWQYPTKGTGQSSAYTSSSGASVPSINFGNTTYNWAQMTNTYDAASSDATKNAVATLMLHCGAAVKMDYGVYGSSSSTNDIPLGLITYFNYDASAKLYYKSNYGTLAVWESLVTADLEAGRPVLYRGANNNNEGHIFICDGKDSRGAYHFNWGWEGHWDGYFSINDFFDLDNTGLTQDYNFKNEIVMITGIQPNNSGISESTMILNEGTGLISSKSKVEKGENFTVKAHFRNAGFLDFTGEYHIVLLNTEKQILSSLASINNYPTLPGGSWWTDYFTFNCSVPTTIADGNYTIRAAVKKSGSSSYVLTDATSGQIQELSLTVGNPGEEAINVTGVSLNKTSETLVPNEQLQLSATIAPANATNKNISWSSSNESVATVSNNGLLKALADGTTTITVETEDGRKTATCEITVETPTISVTGVTLNKTKETLAPNDQLQLTATIAPANATNQNVTWDSSDKSVATVSNGGLVKALADGTTTITVKTEDGDQTATCEITVETPTIPVMGVSLNKTSETLAPNDQLQLTATIAPANATNQNVTWDSSDKSVATVSSSGLVKALADGTTTITVETEDGNKTATCEITVGTPTIAVTGVTLNKTKETLAPNDQLQLTATVAPANASNQNVTWDSSDKSVATVSPGGLVKALADGTTTITVETEDGNKTATCEITVETPTIAVTGVTLNKTSETLAPNDQLQLTATIAPANASNKAVTWNSSNNSVATISDSGLVKALADGTTTITVTTEDGNKTATCIITVETPTVSVTGIEFDNVTYTLSPGEEFRFTVIVSPENATNKNVSWSSSNESVATVSNTGLVKALSEGITTITVVTEDGGIAASYGMIVYDEISKTVSVVEADQAGSDGFGTISISIRYGFNLSLKGSFTLMLPEGMEVDPQKTSLHESLQTNHDLNITANPSKSWLFEISSNALRQTSDPLPYTEIVKIVYKVAEDVENGTYTASISDFDFSFEDGDRVVIDNREFNLTVDQSSSIQSSQSDISVYLRNSDELYINTPTTETISIYTIVGSRIYLSEKPSGEWIINTGRTSETIWIVKGSSGWIKKILVK